MKSKYQKDWDRSESALHDRGESFVFVKRELVPVKYVVARNKVDGSKIDYMVWKKMSNEEQHRYELEDRG